MTRIVGNVWGQGRIAGGMSAGGMSASGSPENLLVGEGSA